MRRTRFRGPASRTDPADDRPEGPVLPRPDDLASGQPGRPCLAHHGHGCLRERSRCATAPKREEETPASAPHQRVAGSLTARHRLSADYLNRLAIIPARGTLAALPGLTRSG